MLSREYLRENADHYRKALKNRGATVDIDRFLELDAERRRTIAHGRGAEESAQCRVAGDRAAQEEQAGRDFADRSDETRRRRHQEARRAPRLHRGRAQEPRALLPERPARIGPGRRRRDREPRRAHVGREAEVQLRAEGSLGHRRIPRHPRLRSRREDHRRSIHSAVRHGREAEPRADEPHARHARAAGLHRGAAAVHGQRRLAARHRTAAEVRGRSLQAAGREAVLPHSHRGSAGDESLPRGVHRRVAAAAVADRIHAMFPRRGRCGGPRHARADPPASVRESRDGEVHHARSARGTSWRN